MKPKEYAWKATIRTGHRITVPDYIMEDWELVEGDKLYVTVNPVSKSITADRAVTNQNQGC